MPHIVRGFLLSRKTPTTRDRSCVVNISSRVTGGGPRTGAGKAIGSPRRKAPQSNHMPMAAGNSYVTLDQLPWQPHSLLGRVHAESSNWVGRDRGPTSSPTADATYAYCFLLTNKTPTNKSCAVNRSSQEPGGSIMKEARKRLGMQGAKPVSLTTCLRRGGNCH